MELDTHVVVIYFYQVIHERADKMKKGVPSTILGPDSGGVLYYYNGLILIW